jgi:hypothetical protein
MTMSCRHCDKDESHPLYVYVANALIGKERKVVVGTSANPLKRQQELNRQPGFVAANKSTRAGAPNWDWELSIGPFANGGANDFKEQLKTKIRNKKNYAQFVIDCAWLFNKLFKPSPLLTVYAREDVKSNLN